MKRNHTAKKVWAIILLVFAIISLALAGVIFAMWQGWLPKPEFPSIPVDDGHGGTIDKPILEISIGFDWGTIGGTAGFGGVCLLLSIILFSMSGKAYMRKINDVYGLPKQGYYRLKAFKFFLIFGGIATGVSTVVGGYYMNTGNQTIILIAMTVSGCILLLGLLLLIPLPMNLVVKRQYKGKKVTITMPAISGVSGKFMPNQILNELQAAYNMGYDVLESFEDLSLKAKGKGNLYGRIRFTLRSSDCTEAELRKYRHAIKHGIKKDYPEWYEEELVFEYNIREELSDEYEEHHDLHTSVNDYDIITTYSDGSKTRSSHYTNVVSGHEVITKRDKYYVYDFYLKGDEEVLFDEDDNPFFTLIPGKAIVTDYKKSGSGW